jgi:hypothetical protein
MNAAAVHSPLLYEILLWGRDYTLGLDYLLDLLKAYKL